MSNALVPHPTNGTVFFGRVEEAKSRKYFIPGAPIVLKVGKHSSRGGFGVRHIWARHEKELQAKGYTSVEDVPRYVADIICEGSAILYEGASWSTRVTVVRSRLGVAILEHQDHGDDCYYSVVTAFAHSNAHGVKVGSVVAYAASDEEVPPGRGYGT